ncbi:toll/interleukin-1 receptor domain-containing protein [Streptomyces sp. NPDC056690]|uniref:toll/interleukin-1 receptor domain-containing protein n=1 Tax=unclassified Streptomyces TaxID=2593676 RepID=UPI00362BE914
MGRGERLFVSYAGADRAWAEWVAWHLQDAGYDVELDLWHWGAGVLGCWGAGVLGTTLFCG